MLPLKDDAPHVIQQREHRTATAVFLAVVFVTLVLWHAWLGDDAFVTFRTVDNFVRGHGLRWNVAERVQGFTHPLWALLLCAAQLVTREIFYTVYAVSALIAFATVGVLASRIALTSAHAVVAVFALSLSRAVIEYSTSGLENVLTHGLLIGFAWVYFSGPIDRPRFRRLMWITGALLLNRMDAVWLVIAPAMYSGVLAYRAQVTPRQLMRDVIVGTSPFALWLLFSLVYFGFPFPNTAYAKLNTGISAAESWHQGFFYALSLLNTDPASVLCLTSAIALSARRSTPVLDRMWLLGALLYSVYAMRVGGDFMQGRFFSAPVMIAAVTIARAALPLHTVSMQLACLGSLALIVVGVEYPPPVPNSVRGVSNERGHYFKETSLVSARRVADPPDHPWARQGAKAAADNRGPVVRNVIGLFGWKAGPSLHIVDMFALTDPLLARIPAKRDVQWRVGHFERVIPKGYLDTIRTGEPRMRDKALGRYYAALHTVIAGPIWSWERWVRIWQLNTGALDHLIDHDRYRHPDRKRIALAALGKALANGTPWDQPDAHPFDSSGLEIDLDRATHSRRIALSLDSNDDYALVFLSGKEELGQVMIEASYFDGLYTYERTVPDTVAARGYDRIRIYPTQGKSFSIGHMQLK